MLLQEGKRQEGAQRVNLTPPPTAGSVKTMVYGGAFRPSIGAKHIIKEKN